MVPRLRHFCVLLFTSLPLVAAAASGAEPVMFRRDAAHRANYEVAPIRHAPRVKWKTALAGEVYSSPVAVDGVAYVGGAHNRFYAIDLATGKIRWQAETLGAASSSPAVADGVVYFGDASGRFHALDARTGAERWVHTVIGEHVYGACGLGGAPRRKKYYEDNFDVFLSSPVIVGDTVYYASGNGAIFALDRASGTPRWSCVTDDSIHCAPAVADGRLYVGGWDTYFYCLDAQTGALVWKFQTGDDPENHNQVGILSAPVVADGTVYFGCRDAHLYALDAATGALRWKHEHHGSWVIASPVIVGDLVCYTTSDSRQFLALDRHTGEIRHELPTRSWSFSSAVAAGDVVYFGTYAGDLNAFDTATGRLLWTWQTDAAKRDRFHLLDAQGACNPGPTIFANYDPENLVAVLEKLHSLGGILGTPFPCGDCLLVPTVDGFLYALE